MSGIVTEVLKGIFDKPDKSVFGGRQEGPRRPERASKEGYLGRGYSGPGGAMKGRDTKEKEPDEEKPEAITEFENVDDFVLSMLLVSLLHANPGITAEEAVKYGKQWVRKLYLPRSEHIWRKQTSRIKRFGIRAEASKIRREMFKLL